jgi:CRISPR-associated protein Cas5h
MREIDKVLVFDIWGDYAHFRRGYTTTSPLTYPFPPRTTLSGFVGAILGLPRDSYYEFFKKDNSAFALQILTPIKKIRITLNLIDTKHGFTPWEIQSKGQAPRTQILFEFIKNPKYRMYIWLKNNKMFTDLVESIKYHKAKYTPYLGISECIANFEIYGSGIFGIKKQSVNTKEDVEIHSIVNREEVKKIKLEEGKIYGSIKVPGFMDKDRRVLKFIGFYYEENGNSLTIPAGLIREYYSLHQQNVNIVFF